MMMRRFSSLLVVLLLFAAACTSTQPATMAGGAASGAPADTLVVQEAGEALSAREERIVEEAVRILKAPQFKEALKAMRGGEATELSLEDRTIILEPDAPLSGMTLFEENGFVIGREALASTEELYKTVLHELYRLHTSVLQESGADPELVRTETEAAFSFAERAAALLTQRLR